MTAGSKQLGCSSCLWGTNNLKQSLPQRYVCVGCQFNSEQALRLFCLKGHVRARDSTLWRYRWQEASEFLCTKINLLEGVQPPKKSPKPPGNALLIVTFSECRGWCRKIKTTCSARFFETALRAVLINNEFDLIRGQRFWKVIFFTEKEATPCSLHTHSPSL